MNIFVALLFAVFSSAQGMTLNSSVLNLSHIMKGFSYKPYAPFDHCNTKENYTLSDLENEINSFNERFDSKKVEHFDSSQICSFLQSAPRVGSALVSFWLTDQDVRGPKRITKDEGIQNVVGLFHDNVQSFIVCSLQSLSLDTRRRMGAVSINYPNLIVCYSDLKKLIDKDLDGLIVNERHLESFFKYYKQIFLLYAYNFGNNNWVREVCSELDNFFESFGFSIQRYDQKVPMHPIDSDDTGFSSDSVEDDDCSGDKENDLPTIVITIDLETKLHNYISSMLFLPNATEKKRDQWCDNFRACGELLATIFVDCNGDLSKEANNMKHLRDVLEERISLSFKHFATLPKKIGGSTGLGNKGDFDDAFKIFKYSIKQDEDIKVQAENIKIFWQKIADSYAQYGLNLEDPKVYENTLVGNIKQFFDYIVTGIHRDEIIIDDLEDETNQRLHQENKQDKGFENNEQIEELNNLENKNPVENDEIEKESIFQNMRSGFWKHPKIYSGLLGLTTLFASLCYTKMCYPNYFKRKQTN